MTPSSDGAKLPFVVEWRDGFRTGIDKIDRQHLNLFALVRSLDLHSVDHTVEALLNYVVTHFSDEQALMEQSGYPAFEQHLQLHEDFAVHVADFMGGGDAWTQERVNELRRFLNKWLISHIMTHDMRFGKWYAVHYGPDGQAATPDSAGTGLVARLFRGRKPR
jgi:hemerythrin